MKTDVDGNPINDAESGNPRFRSCTMYVDVEVKLASVTLNLYNENGEELLNNELKEGSSYYIKITPDMISGNIQENILDSYLDGLEIKANANDPADANKIMPVQIGKINYYNDDV